MEIGRRPSLTPPPFRSLDRSRGPRVAQKSFKTRRNGTRLVDDGLMSRRGLHDEQRSLIYVASSGLYRLRHGGGHCLRLDLRLKSYKVRARSPG